MSSMSAKAFMVRRINGTKCLVPSDPFSEELMENLKEGREVLVDVKRPRNLQQLRFLFALLRRVIENTDRWADTETLLEDLKLATGLFETRVSAITGLPYPVPSSISVASMTQERFEAWFRKAIDVLARDVLSVMPEELKAEIEEMVGLRSRRAA